MFLVVEKVLRHITRSTAAAAAAAAAEALAGRQLLGGRTRKLQRSTDIFTTWMC